MTTSDAHDLLALAERLTPAERAVRTAAFRLVLRGEPAEPADVLANAGLDPEMGRAALERLVERGLLALAAGRLVGAFGLSLQPGRHRLVLDGRVFATWCAFDAVGIPAALHGNADLQSTCAQCGEPIALAFAAGVPRGGERIRLWFAEADFDRPLTAT